ncbi:peptidylprolyl isomerase [Paracoccus sp. R12_1]|uniref:peptidylprolyl isomerase n=1 Tax=unclassified Paracoccus (in: a-proteobacteria) TaxID=2688777 RepID=UPI001ADA71FF|nr:MULTISPECIES: peptidylprolyl isomerase [unclassified Paracoccus (in: a-proteobacteria)]MBO9453720.1 peptidylprolyl isomerase [Paracoccus sp. R12_2]MBO9486856.1 peptidylprolyl isomerase [Paracoccus sp. R12_1]
MRHILSGIALVASLLIGAAAPAAAQNPFEPIVYVNDKAVTRYELQQRMRFMEVLGSPADTATAEQALIDDRLRMFAAGQLGIEVTDEGLQAGLEEFASRAGLSAAEFTAALERAGVEPQVYRDFVTAGIAWRGVIRARLLPQVDVSDAEVDQELKRQVETPIVTRVLLSELIIPAPEGQEQAAMNRARSIAGSNPSEAQFAAAARQYSASGTASSGGQLNWLAIENLPPSLRPVILSLRPGQTSQPLNVPGAVVLFQLRDTQGTLRPGAREQVLDYMTLRLASSTEAAQLAARARSCDTLYSEAGSAAGAIQRQTQSQNAIPTLIATQLASLDDNEAAVVNYGNAAELVMLCSRQPAILAEAQNDVATTALPDDGVEAAVPDAQALPDREVVREELFNRKASTAADAYLAELRADAVIRRP